MLKRLEPGLELSDKHFIFVLFCLFVFVGEGGGMIKIWLENA